MNGEGNYVLNVLLILILFSHPTGFCCFGSVLLRLKLSGSVHSHENLSSSGWLYSLAVHKIKIIKPLITSTKILFDEFSINYYSGTFIVNASNKSFV
jgi:hypothetical protein